MPRCDVVLTVGIDSSYYLNTSNLSDLIDVVYLPHVSMWVGMLNTLDGDSGKSALYK